METEKYPYQKEWEEYKLREKLYWGVLFAFIPCCYLSSTLLNYIFDFGNSGSFNSLLISFMIYGIAWIVVGSDCFFGNVRNAINLTPKTL